jgi:hypothetical protein
MNSASGVNSESTEIGHKKGQRSKLMLASVQ